ncbi:hypothetical protein GGF46_002420 [Coemansia sp. RSA 552]|nr:hypothetical protein GGF46_002420 [Coemansia sp. RSA 552]
MAATPRSHALSGAPRYARMDGRGPALPSPSRAVPISATPDLGLHGAVARGDVGSICYALLGGQPIDSLRDGLQPIHVAASQADPAIVEILVQNGADVNAQTTPLAELMTPVCMARPDRSKLARKHQRGMRSRSSFSFLKYSGVGPISAPTGFTTGLHSMQAARSATGDRATCDQYREYHGATPLHYAVAGARLACVDALLRSGARVDVPDSYGNTAASIAAVCGRADVTAMVGRQLLSKPMSPRAPGIHMLPSPDPSDQGPGEPSPALTAYTLDLSDETPLASARSSRTRSEPPPPPPAEARRLEPSPRAPVRRRTAGEADAELRYTGSAGNGQPAGSSWLSGQNTAPARRRSVEGSELQRPATTGCCLGALEYVDGRRVSRNTSSGSRRERSYTDSVIERAWRRYLKHGDEQSCENAHKLAANDTGRDVRQPLPEPWMWQQAAIAVRNRRSQSLSASPRQSLDLTRQPPG